MTWPAAHDASWSRTSLARLRPRRSRLARAGVREHPYEEPCSVSSGTMILHPAAWAVLILGAIIVVWFTIRDDV